MFYSFIHLNGLNHTNLIIMKVYVGPEHIPLGVMPEIMLQKHKCLLGFLIYLQKA